MVLGNLVMDKNDITAVIILNVKPENDISL